MIHQYSSRPAVRVVGQSTIDSFAFFLKVTAIVLVYN